MQVASHCQEAHRQGDEPWEASSSGIRLERIFGYLNEWARGEGSPLAVANAHEGFLEGLGLTSVSSDQLALAEAVKAGNKRARPQVEDEDEDIFARDSVCPYDHASCKGTVRRDRWTYEQAFRHLKEYHAGITCRALYPFEKCYAIPGEMSDEEAIAHFEGHQKALDDALRDGDVPERYEEDVASINKAREEARSTTAADRSSERPASTPAAGPRRTHDTMRLRSARALSPPPGPARKGGGSTRIPSVYKRNTMRPRPHHPFTIVAIKLHPHGTKPLTASELAAFVPLPPKPTNYSNHRAKINKPVSVCGHCARVRDHMLASDLIADNVGIGHSLPVRAGLPTEGKRTSRPRQGTPSLRAFRTSQDRTSRHLHDTARPCHDR